MNFNSFDDLTFNAFVYINIHCKLIFFNRFAVCSTCIAIDENIRKAGTNERDRKLWQRAKKEHRDYVRSVLTSSTPTATPVWSWCGYKRITYVRVRTDA